MSIYLNKDSKIIVQGMTGGMGSKHTTLMVEAGSNIVGGVNARKAGTSVELGGKDLPVFGSVEEAMKETGADVSVVFVPPAFTKDACIEAIDAGIGLLVVITEGVPVQDSAEVWAYLDGKSTRMIGPNCPGIITPEESLAGITPHTIAGKGPVGLVSKSGTLTYQMMFELKDYGFTTAIGIGGDPVIGTSHIDALEAFEKDPDTKAIVMIGEIGGDAEERAADYIKDHVTKPVVGYVAGFTAPEGKTMGHAGAIVSGSSGTAAGQEGSPRGGRGQGRQDAVRDRPADAGDPGGAVTLRCRFPRSTGETGTGECFNAPARSFAGRPAKPSALLRDRVPLRVRRVEVLLVRHHRLEALDGESARRRGCCRAGRSRSGRCRGRGSRR